MPRLTTKSIPVPVIVIDSVLGLLCIGLTVFGILRATESIGQTCLIIGSIGLVIVVSTFAAGWIIASALETSGGQSQTRPAQSSSGISETLLRQIHENSMLSDAAKRVLFREHELQLLRDAIEEDIAHADYNAGMTLCDDMANLFGHREEAEAYRTRIVQAGQASFETKVRHEMEQFEHVLTTRDWGRCYSESARIRRLYPDHHLVVDIDQRILRARDEHKQGLESEFIEAANRQDVDAAMNLMKELDRYLTRDEAERLAQTAQDVVAQHRDQLSSQFKLAVNDRRWAEAARIGDTIIQQYPNTKMAEEVRNMIDVLRVRATQAAVAAEG